MDWRQIEQALADACHDEGIPVGNSDGDRCAIAPSPYHAVSHLDREVAEDVEEVVFNLTELAKRLERNGFGK